MCRRISMRQYASSPRKEQEWIREIRGERQQGIAEGASSAPHLASSSAASFTGRNECPGTHCSLIEQEEREDCSCQICQRVCGRRKEVRTERELYRRRREEKWQTCCCFRDQQRTCRMAQASAENLNKLGLMKRKEWPQYHKESSWQVRRSRPCQKEKEQSRLSRESDHEWAESQGERESHLGERKRGIRARAWKGKSGLQSERKQIPRRKGRASNKSFLRTSRRKHERVSGCKSSTGRSAVSWFHS